MDEAIAPQPLLLDPTPDAPTPDVPTAREPRRRPRWPGRLALALGILTPLAVAFGILTATDDAYLPATLLAYLALGASASAVVTGVVAIIGRWGRGAGIAGVVLGVLANPLVLLYGLRTLGGL